MNTVQKRLISMKDIYEAIGSLKTDVTNIKDTADKHYDLLVIIKDKLGEDHTDKILMKSQINAVHDRLDKAEPKIDKHDTIIGRMIWLGSLIVTAVTLLIQWASPFIGRLIP